MSKVFDEKNVALAFAAISDVHLTTGEDDSVPKFTAALRQLKERAGGRGLDAVIVAGDLIDSRNIDEVRLFKKIYECILPGVPLVYCLGDGHDLLWGEDGRADKIAWYSDIFGEEHFRFDTERDIISEGNRHTVINGYHIISLTPVHRSPILYGEKTKRWLSKTLAEINERDGEKHIFFVTHPMIHNTCYGSTLGDEWDTSDLTPILSKYPQIIAFGGHMHFPLIDERSIMQKGFTSVGCGSVRYMALEHGFMFQRGYLVQNGYRFSQGLFCEVDSNDRVRLTRMDFKAEEEIKSPWIIGKGLDDYGGDRGLTASAPHFPADAGIYLTDGKNSLGERTHILCFTAATDDDFVHHYLISVKNPSGDEIINKKMLTDFFRHALPCDMEKECRVDIGFLYDGEYEISIRAVNSWDKVSPAICEKIKICQG